MHISRDQFDKGVSAEDYRLREIFLESAENPIVLLSSVEYLVSRSSFAAIYLLVQNLWNKVAMKDGIMLITVNPKAFKEELARLKRELMTLNFTR